MSTSDPILKWYRAVAHGPVFDDTTTSEWFTFYVDAEAFGKHKLKANKWESFSVEDRYFQGQAPC